MKLEQTKTEKISCHGGFIPGTECNFDEVSKEIHKLKDNTVTEVLTEFAKKGWKLESSSMLQCKISPTKYYKGMCVYYYDIEVELNFIRTELASVLYCNN